MVGRDVQLERGVDADEQAHGLDDQPPQLHRVHQGPRVLSHLHGQHLPPCAGPCRVASQPAVRKVGVEQSFDVVYKGVLHVEPCWFQFKRELADIEEALGPLRAREAELDEAAPLVFLQVLAGHQETLHSGERHGFWSLPLAHQHSKVEVGLVVELVVQLQVPNVDLHTEKLEEGGGGLLPGEDTRRRTHVEKDVVRREP